MALQISQAAIEALTKAIKDMKDSGLTVSGMDFGAGQAQLAERTSSHQTVVSRKAFEELAQKHSRAAQRLTMLLSLLSFEDLQKIGLLTADEVSKAEGPEPDQWDRIRALNALDEKIDTFNKAHQRLTGKKKLIPETGSMELDTSEMGIVAKMRSERATTQQILQKLHAERNKRNQL